MLEDMMFGLAGITLGLAGVVGIHIWVRIHYRRIAVEAVNRSEIHRLKAHALSKKGDFGAARSEMKLAEEVLKDAQARL